MNLKVIESKGEFESADAHTPEIAEYTLEMNTLSPKTKKIEKKHSNLKIFEDSKPETFENLPFLGPYLYQDSSTYEG